MGLHQPGQAHPHRWLASLALHPAVCRQRHYCVQDCVHCVAWTGVVAPGNDPSLLSVLYVVTLLVTVREVTSPAKEP